MALAKQTLQRHMLQQRLDPVHRLWEAAKEVGDGTTCVLEKFIPSALGKDSLSVQTLTHNSKFKRHLAADHPTIMPRMSEHAMMWDYTRPPTAQRT
jgi:hypothetical protein